MKLLSTGNPKVLKGIKQGYNTYILHLAPAKLSGHEVCPKRTVGCTDSCLNLAGRGGMFKRGEVWCGVVWCGVVWRGVVW